MSVLFMALDFLVIYYYHFTLLFKILHYAVTQKFGTLLYAL